MVAKFAALVALVSLVHSAPIGKGKISTRFAFLPKYVRCSLSRAQTTVPLPHISIFQITPRTSSSPLPRTVSHFISFQFPQPPSEYRFSTLAEPSTDMKVLAIAGSNFGFFPSTHDIVGLSVSSISSFLHLSENAGWGGRPKVGGAWYGTSNCFYHH